MATADEYAAWIVKNSDKKGTPEFDIVAKAYKLAKIDPKQDPAMSPTSGMSGMDKFLAGIGKSMYDAGRGVGQLVGAVSQDDIKAARKMDAPLMDTGAGMAGDVAGTIGMALLPGGAVKGAGMLFKNPALSAMGSTLLAPNTIPSALTVGGGMGFIQPAESMRERATNTGIGAGATALIPAAGRAYQAAKSAVEPFYEAGQQRIMGKLLNRAAGDQAPQAMAAMRSATELVPGSIPTAGQSSGNAGIAAVERASSAIDPTVTTAYAERMAQQNAARVNALREMSGSDGQRALFAADRDTAANQLYDAAYKAGVDLRRDATTGQFLSKAQQAARKGEITKLMQTPALQEASDKAMSLMRNDPNLKGQVLNPSGSVQGLDYTRRALSDMIGSTQGNEQRILINLRDRLDTTLNTISPKYAEARSTFAEMSKPINQMDVAQHIADKSIRALDDVIKPTQFAGLLNDQTAKTATGWKGATLDKVMSPEQMGLLGNIKSDLARAEFAKNAGRGAGSDTVQKLAYSNIIEGAGIPTWLQNMSLAQIGGNIASRGADAVYGRANREMATKLAQGLLTPQEAAQWMAIANQSQQPSVIGLLGRGITPLGMAAPGLLQGRQ